MQNYPIRWAVGITAGLGAVGLFFLEWSTTGDWKLALGKALSTFTLPAAGGAVAERWAYAPSTANEILDADAVIAKAERG